MRVYFSTAAGRPLKALSADYVPLVGDRVYLEFKKWVVVSREFDSEPNMLRNDQELFARVTVEETP